MTLPLPQAATLTQIEFLALSENRVLVILVFNDREVQNRIIQLERRYHAPRNCGAPANYLNEQLPRPHAGAGAPGAAAPAEGDARDDLNQVMLDAIAMAQQAVRAAAAARQASST